MKTFSMQQGSDEWHELRARCRTASVATAMMGASKKTRRTELLHMKKTGTSKEFSEWVQKNILDKGHEVEAKARPITVSMLDDDLFPVTGTDDDEYLLASFDGITIDDSVTWEHKQWNEEKAALVREGRIPEEDFWQVVQQAVVSRAERCLYTVSDGTAEKRVDVWYTLTPEDEKALRAGWKQFDEDLETYVPPEAKAGIVGTAVTELPSVSVQVSGAIAIIDNFDFFEEALKDFVATKLIRDPKTDQDFADLDLQVKSLEKSEKALEAAETHMIAQVASIDTFKRRKDALSQMARTNRLMAEKLIVQFKDSIRLRIKTDTETAWREHLDKLNKRLAVVRLPEIKADFAAVMKGKRTIATLEDAASTELARAKIAANELADTMEANLKTVKDMAPDHQFLFNDLQPLVMKAPDDLAATITVRLQKHKQEEDAKLERERERIRKEEQDKLAQEQAAEKVRQDAAEKARQDAAAASEKVRQDAEDKKASEQAAAAAIVVAPEKTGQTIIAGVDTETGEVVEPATTKPHAHTQWPAGTGYATTSRTTSRSTSPSTSASKPEQPTDAQIIAILALHFKVDVGVVLDWLMAMDLEALADNAP